MTANEFVSYNDGMKKLILLIFIVTTLMLSLACNATQLPEDTATDGTTPPVQAPSPPNYEAPTLPDGNTPDLPSVPTPPNDEQAPPQTENPPQEEEAPAIELKEYLVSSVNSLRVRARASSGGEVYGYLDKGDALAITGREGDYYRTVFRERTAYVHKDYCEVMAVPTADEKVEEAIAVGLKLMGHPYVWGSQRYHWGNGRLNTSFVAGQFDCSALVQYVYFISCGVALDVTSRAQSYNGKEVLLDDLQRGDLMFFTNEARKHKVGVEKIGHVGIYFGNNYILHTASDHAVTEPISPTRWGYLVTIRRVV